MPPTVLVPAYRPGAAMLQTVADLRAARPDWGIVVVDDGSGTAYDDRFAQVRAAGADVVTLPVNRGKGAALKAGLAHVLSTRPGSPVVCADADGQHALDDIVAVGERLLADPTARRLVLGTRTFDGSVPLRSRVGNTVTRWLFLAATRTRVPDTQTGLRGIPAGLLGWACGVPGERYEYELQVLLRAGRSGIALDPLPIATIYLEDNASSHFRPVVDSLRVYAPLLAFLASSLAAFVIDTVALLVLQAITGTLLLSVVGARLTSAGVNFVVNRRLVFDAEHRVRTRTAAVRYAVLATALLALNFLLLSALGAAGIALLPAKVLTELALVSTSFAAQRSFVFRAPGAFTGGAQRQPTSPTGTSTTVDTTVTAARRAADPMTNHDHTSPTDEGTTMDDQLPDAPTTTGTETAYAPPVPAAKRTWRERIPTGRTVVAGGAVVAGLAVGGAGFGAGYAVGHDDTATVGTTNQQTTDGFDGRGFPGDGRGPMGDMGGQMPGGPLGGQGGGTTQDGGGTTGRAPDFDGDGQPDTDSGTDSGTATDSGALNS